MIDFLLENAKVLLNADELTDEERIQEKINFNNLMIRLFEKYMQVALDEMVIQINSDETKLSEEYFEELPESALMNLDNFNLFQNFVESDLKIEIMRSQKLEVISNIVADEIDDNYLKNMDEKNPDDKIILDKVDTFIEKELRKIIVDNVLNKSVD